MLPVAAVKASKDGREWGYQVRRVAGWGFYDATCAEDYVQAIETHQGEIVVAAYEAELARREGENRE